MQLWQLNSHTKSQWLSKSQATPQKQQQLQKVQLSHQSQLWLLRMALQALHP